MTELPIDENTPRILIVEDEPKLGQLLIDYLRAASYAPTLINHGDKVLPYVRQTPPGKSAPMIISVSLTARAKSWPA